MFGYMFNVQFSCNSYMFHNFWMTEDTVQAIKLGAFKLHF